ncbi:MAG: class I SAM-dependent RNA methyltransferase [Candidatus Marinimicrobia bacterium]|nr:class I SAM-dependent RNA methyltransferase [Candidatus Neomarinimicrobiota bacterium]MCF7828705.1 class I SAM-dependent RNA methyltransferase [Candidatus Neomarinimicrobiota bacterium]MCF7880446.1 class I SAM-dependent RNA methyltransferase [Candidatus Neomarinimicrobiota bacterium]
MTATTLYGLEGILATELKSLGAADIKQENRAVTFRGDKRLMYRANLELRTALKVLVPIHSFTARDEKTLYHYIREVDWSQYLDLSDTLAVDSVVHSKHFTHSKYVALKTKDAIVDQFRKKTGKRPSVDVEDPSLRINLYISHDECIVSLDSSGDSLHRRGYRRSGDQAPLNEVLAAGMIQLTGWDRNSHFIDPMCGAGTILCEAAMYARNISPGIYRETFGFRKWPDFDAYLWEEVRAEARAKVREFGYLVIGSDRSGNALDAARENIVRAELDDDIRLSRTPFEERTPSVDSGILVMNPPYGERMKVEDIKAFYGEIGDQLKQHYPGFDAWILSGNLEAIKHVGLRPAENITLYNGPIECRFQKFPIYRGSK